MKYGIAIFPSKKLQDIVNSYRKRYDPKYALIPPHLTLKESFETSDEEIKLMIPEIRRIAEETTPFTLNCYKVSSFHPANNTIYFGVEKDEKLMTLQSELNKGNLEKETRYNFVPHITIGQNLSDDEHSDVLGRLKMKNISHEEKIDRFQLLYQLENDQWTVYETFHLGKDRAES